MPFEVLNVESEDLNRIQLNISESIRALETQVGLVSDQIAALKTELENLRASA